MFYKSILLTFLILSSSVYGQIGIGQWRDHLPYSKTISVTEGEDERIYCSTPYGAFFYNQKDNSVNRLNRVTGLSDVSINTLNFDPNTKTLVIAYTNANIDLYKDDQVFNISDIKRKSIVGSKKINRITFRDKLCYLSCDFGIVVLDLVKKEIKDTYYIGPNGSSIIVNDFTYDDSLFYAATESGVYDASVDEPFLSNYAVWSHDSSMVYPNGNYNSIAIRKGHLYANMSNPSFGTDTIFEKFENSWKIFSGTTPGPNYRLRTFNDTLVIVSAYAYKYYWNNMTDSLRIYEYVVDGEKTTPQPRDLIFDSKNTTWIADNAKGLVESKRIWKYEYIKISGPPYEYAYSMSSYNGAIWIASGAVRSNWGNRYLRKGIYKFEDEDWAAYNVGNTAAFDSIQDVLKIAINPLNSNEIYIGSWGKGLMQMNGGTVSKIFNSDNSPLQDAINYSGFIGIAGLAYDQDNNLWVTNTANPNALHMKDQSGKWYTYSLSPLVSNDVVGDLVIDHEGQKWIIMPRGHGIIVYNDNFTIDNPFDDRKIRLSQAVGNGNLPSSGVYSIAVDREGEVWVGTDKGVAVFYSPGLVFSGQNFDAQQVYIEQSGISQYLLESEIVTSIAIDGANQKWFGTRNAGVFLMSSDGTEQIFHFTQENSPLLSNNIFSITINGNSGEVFFGTENGVVSFRGYATEGKEVQEDSVQVYPNPVREDYNGPIAINGLVQDAIFHIADAYGNVVYQGVAQGGQAVWNGKDYSGNRVMTGVYFVFASNSDGEQTKVAKILFIH